MAFLKNAWTIAAWGSELQTGQLLARTLLDVPVVLFRDSAGQAHALFDRCPHRFAPLSMGHLSDGGNSVECVYHGLRFDATGRCVLNPHGDGQVPKAAVVQRFPLVERWSALWIWMGDASLADPAIIPDFSFLDPAHWAVGIGSMIVDGPYELEIDNILDLSHIEFLHPLFASPAVRRAKFECTQDGSTVWSKRFVRNDHEAPDFVRAAFQVTDGPIDRWMDVRWDAPANMALWAGGVASGRAPEEGIVNPAAHCFTPLSASRTHYFYAIACPRSIGPQAQALADSYAQASRVPFEQEDKPLIEAVAQRMGGADLWSLKPVLLPGDAAGVRARRVLAGLIGSQA